MPYLSEICLFCAAFIAAFAYGGNLAKALDGKISAGGGVITKLGADLRAWLSRRPN
jgi:sugar/nucleoside kinase (ribokinase family)